MPKAPRHAVAKRVPYGKGRKIKRKRRAARYPAPLAAKRASLPGRIPATPSARLTPPIQRIVPQQLYVLKDWKRSGIVAGALLLLLIILSLVL